MTKQCQSCGMPLITEKAGDCRGSEVDGSKSQKWCLLCYEKGSFINPNLTVNGMIGLVDKALKEDGSSSLFRWMAKRQIPRLERWRKS